MQHIYKAICTVLISTTFFLFSTSPSRAQLAISYGTPLVTGLNNAVDIANAGDTRLFIAQQNGLIRAWNGTTLTTFMDLGGQGLFPNPLGSEQGLLSIAFHPGFATNRYLFVWYTASDGAVTLARYRANVALTSADPTAGVVLLRIEKPGDPYFTNHNGGKLNFGPDGKLYIGTGDGGDGGDPFNNAQNGNSLLGKMLRLDVDGFATAQPFYDIPADNPFLVTGDGIRDEIFALGLRNPWRWSFDRANGSMWIADVGQGVYEEVNYQTAATASGRNYGWRCREGMHNYNGGCGAQAFTEPLFEYNHSTGGQSITGGYVYRGPDAMNAPLLGRYITTDYISGNVWIIENTGSFIKQTANTLTNISSYGEAADGTLYAIRRGNNQGLYKVNLLTVTPLSVVNFSGEGMPGYNLLKWTASPGNDISIFEVEYSSNGVDYVKVGQRAFAGTDYTFQHNLNSATTSFYRLKISGADGSSKYSPVIRISGADESAISVTPTYVTGRSINLYTRVLLTRMQLISGDGRVVYDRNIKNTTGAETINLPAVAPGIYIVKLTGPAHSKTEKIYIK